MSEDLIRREDAIKAVEDEMCTFYDCYVLDRINAIPSADRPQGEFTKREYRQFLHGISLSLLSKRSAQHWRYDEETAQEIQWLESLEQKVRARMKGAEEVLKEAREQDHTCEFCYYESFKENEYPCSRCVCNVPTENKWQPKWERSRR